MICYNRSEEDITIVYRMTFSIKFKFKFELNLVLKEKAKNIIYTTMSKHSKIQQKEKDVKTISLRHKCISTHFPVLGQVLK